MLRLMHRSARHTRQATAQQPPGKRALDAASVSGMDEDDKAEATTTRREYHLLLREIQTLMAEVQRQRSDFRTELRSLASTIIRRHNTATSPLAARPCVCSANPRKTSRLPLMVGGHRATSRLLLRGPEIMQELKLTSLHPD